MPGADPGDGGLAHGETGLDQVTGDAGLDGALRRPIRLLDRVLRCLQRIAEYSRHPHCLLRIAHGRADREVRLADGHIIRRSAGLLDLHLWNERLARAYGFDTALAAGPPRRPTRIEAFRENLLILALAWAFNPASLRRAEMRRERCELWISRKAMLARYGNGVPPGGAAAACRRPPVSSPPAFAFFAGIRPAGGGDAARSRDEPLGRGP
jgi:hypothetical protein